MEWPRHRAFAATVVVVLLAFAGTALAVGHVTKVYCHNCKLGHNTAVTDGTHNETTRNQLHTTNALHDGIYEMHAGTVYYHYISKGPGYVDINHLPLKSKALCENRSSSHPMLAKCEYTKEKGS